MIARPPPDRHGPACGGRSAPATAGRSCRSARDRRRIRGHRPATRSFHAASPAARTASASSRLQAPEERRHRLGARLRPADRQHADHHARPVVALQQRMRVKAFATPGERRPERAIGQRPRLRRIAGRAASASNGRRSRRRSDRSRRDRAAAGSDQRRPLALPCRSSPGRCRSRSRSLPPARRANSTPNSAARCTASPKRPPFCAS